MKQPLAGFSLSEIETFLSGLPRFRAKQIYKWITKGVNSFEQMTDIPLTLQKQLQESFCLFSASVTDCYEDENTRKTALSLIDGSKAEAVLLRDGKNRLTACISTQAGCPAGCVFCKTGSLGFKRNLTSSEIAEQFLILKNFIPRNSADSSLRYADKNKDDKKEDGGHLIDNIVVMGMGEPLLNLENLRKAIEVFTCRQGLNFSKRRITVSTCGICSGLFDIASNGPYVRLALSLTTADEALRQRLMPVTKSNPLEEVKKALKLFQDSGGGRVTLEVPLLGGINTRGKDASSIADFSKNLDTVINIIPWNPVSCLKFEGNPLREPEKKEVSDFIRMLENYGLKVTMRLHKGQKIMGACGQLG